MPNTKTAIEEVAEELAVAFEDRKRDSGEPFAVIRDDAPAWTREDDESGQCLMLRVHRAVDDRLPDDWIYASASNIASSLTEYDSLDAMRGAVSEIADGQVDVYNVDRSRWLASSLANAGLVDEAVEELGHSDQGVHGDIGMGQYVALERIAFALIDAIEAEAEKRN